MTENQLNVLYCPRCGHSNTLYATRCVECGLVYPSTIPVDDLVPDAQPVTALETPSARARLEQAGTIVLSIAGHDRPLFVRRQPEITLGRSAPGEDPPTVDLNPFRGQKMGVSRRHALIRLTDDQALIEDLGSVNGSWLNENRLEPRQPRPLRNGDYVRFGHLIMVIHASAIDTLVLIDTIEKTDKRLTTTVLTEQVAPFLSALTDLQNVINALMNQRAAPVTVHSMNAGAKGAIHVRLSGATESLDLLRSDVMPWRRRHNKLLNDTKMLSAETRTEPAADDQPSVMEATISTEAETVSQPAPVIEPAADSQPPVMEGAISTEAETVSQPEPVIDPAADSQPSITTIDISAEAETVSQPEPVIELAANSQPPVMAAEPQPLNARDVQSRFHNAYRMLFQAVLDRIAAGKAEADIVPHRATLTTALNQLAFNPLEMSESSMSGDLVEPDLGGLEHTQGLFGGQPPD